MPILPLKATFMLNLSYPDHLTPEEAMKLFQEKSNWEFSNVIIDEKTKDTTGDTSVEDINMIWLDAVAWTDLERYEK